MKIIISSASPQPILEAAKEALGVDDVIYSGTQAAEGYLNTPYRFSKWFGVGRPRKVSPPSEEFINASHAKIDGLLERYPDIFAPGVVSIGITDTGYGEDHCWSSHFTRVVDVNSRTPFAPIVAAASPLQEVHSAAILTQEERR